MTGARATARTGILATIIAIAIVLVDVVRAPGARIVGLPYIDGYGTQWFYDWAVDVARGREGMAHTARLFYPWGKDVGVHTGGNLLDAWLAWPFRAGFGPAWGYDLWIAALLAANAFGGWCLAGALLDSGAGLSAPQRPGGVPSAEPGEARRPWRGLAAVGMVLHPFVLGELQFGRPTQALLVFPALALALLVRGLRDREPGASAVSRLGAAVACGVLVALTGWTYWFHGVALGACAGAWSLAHLGGRLLRREGSAWVRDAGWLALAGGVALLAVWPAVGPMLAAVDAGTVPGLLAWDGTGPLAPLALRTVEGDAEGLAVLAVLRGGVAGALTDEGGLRFDGGLGGLGGGWLLVTVLAAAAVPRGRRVSMVVALAMGLVLAGGPVLVLGEHLLVSRPYLWLLESLPWLRRWWWPVRAVAMVQVLTVAALPGVFSAAEVWLEGVGASRARAWGVRGGLAALALVLLVSEPLRQGTLPLASWDASGSPVLARLRQEDGFGTGGGLAGASGGASAVIDVPWITDQDNLWLQVLHGRPILGGMLVTKPAFVPAPVAELRARNVLLRGLEGVAGGDWRTPFVAGPEACKALGDLGYGWILARASGFRRPDGAGGWESEWARPRRILGAALGAPEVEDARFALWRLDGACRGEPPG